MLRGSLEIRLAMEDWAEIICGKILRAIELQLIDSTEVEELTIIAGFMALL
jgi:hypothetical protein